MRLQPSLLDLCQFRFRRALGLEARDLGIGRREQLVDIVRPGGQADASNKALIRLARQSAAHGATVDQGQFFAQYFIDAQIHH